MSGAQFAVSKLGLFSEPRAVLSGKAVISCNWINSNTANLIENSLVLHPCSEFNTVDVNRIEEFAESSLTCQILEPDVPTRCIISLQLPSDFVTGIIVICDCSLIEVAAPGGLGYLETSKGILIDEFEETVVNGHIVDLRKNPVNEVELTMITKNKKTRSAVTVFGIHVYHDPVSAPQKPSNLDISGFTMFSNNSSADQMLIPVNMLSRKIDSLKDELCSVEQRLKSHIDTELCQLRRDIMDRLDVFQTKICNSSVQEKRG